MHETTMSVERVLRESRVDTDAIKHSHEAYRRHVQRQADQPAGWHGADGIVTLEGLGGEFSWMENLAQPARIAFTFDAAHVGSQGTYKIDALPGQAEEGVFHCVPNNPAMGWAFISLLPKAGVNRVFTVAGMFTDNMWKISILLLNKIDANGPVNPPFPVLRIM